VPLERETRSLASAPGTVAAGGRLTWNPHAAVKSATATSSNLDRIEGLPSKAATLRGRGAARTSALRSTAMSGAAAPSFAAGAAFAFEAATYSKVKARS
jgi:hypothetical protein